MLYLESLGNPRKFSRIARRLARQKPVVVVKSGRFRGERPGGHLVREPARPGSRGRRAVPAGRRDPRASRSTRCSTSPRWSRPAAARPAGGSRSSATPTRSRVLAADACEEAGLEVVGTPRRSGRTPAPTSSRAALDEVFADDGVDSVVALFIPPLRDPGTEVAEVLAAAPPRQASKTVVSTFLGMPGVPDALRAPGGGRRARCRPTPRPRTPCARWPPSPTYAAWRATPAGHAVSPSGLDVRAARGLVADLLAGHAATTTVDARPRPSCSGCCAATASTCGTCRPAATAGGGGARPPEPRLPGGAQGHRGAPAAPPRARRGAPRHRRRRRAARRLRGDGRPARRARPGASSCRRWRPPAWPPGCATVEDPLFGPVVSFGLGGVATDLLGDRSLRRPAADRRRPRAAWSAAVRAAPLLLGHGGSTPVDVRRARGPAGPAGPAGRRRARGGRARAQPGGRGARPGPRCSPPPAGWPGRRPGPSAAPARWPAEPAVGPPRAHRVQGWTRMTDTSLAGLRAAIERAGYYPELVADAVDAAVAGEDGRGLRRAPGDDLRLRGGTPAHHRPGADARAGWCSATPTTTPPTR